MKILLLNYEFPPIGGGGSSVSYDIAKEMINQGHQVDVITSSFKDLPLFEQKDGINIYRVKSLRANQTGSKPHELLSYVFSAIKFLKKHLKSHKYDVCHTHFLMPTGFVASYLKKKFNLNYIVTVHGSDVLGYNKKFNKLYPILKKPWFDVIKNASKVISPSNFLREEIVEQVKLLDKNYNCEKIQVIHNGIQEDKFKPMKKEKYFLYVGRLVDFKGVQHVIEALKNVKLNGWKFKIVGDGPYKEELEKLVKELKLTTSVQFLGRVDNKSQKMKNLYGKASIYISSSYFENLSMVLLEALSAGCYTLATNVGGNPEVIKKSALFESKNPQTLVPKLQKLINSKEIKPQKLQNKFILKNITKQYLNELKKLI